jgi:hypothetical protein
MKRCTRRIRSYWRRNMKFSKEIQRMGIVGLFLLLPTFVLLGQGLYMDMVPSGKAKIDFRYLRPIFEWGNRLSFFSGAYDLSVSIPVNSGLNIVANLPMGVIGARYGDNSASSICNISLGVKKTLKSRGKGLAFMSFNVYLPTMPNSEYEVGALAFYANYIQMQRYRPNYFALSSKLAYHNMEESGVVYGMEFGPNVFVFSGDEDDEGTQLNLSYGGYVGLRGYRLLFTAELDGILLLTGKDFNLGERLYNRATFGLQYKIGRFKPGVYYGVYLKKEINEQVTGIVGIRLQIDL